MKLKYLHGLESILIQSRNLFLLFLIFYSIGQGALAGASVLGLGALAYYGLGMSKEVGAMERSIMWPEHVKQRIRSTYSKFNTHSGE